MRRGIYPSHNLRRIVVDDTIILRQEIRHRLYALGMAITPLITAAGIAADVVDTWFALGFTLFTEIVETLAWFWSKKKFRVERANG